MRAAVVAGQSTGAVRISLRIRCKGRLRYLPQGFPYWVSMVPTMEEEESADLTFIVGCVERGEGGFASSFSDGVFGYP